MYIELPVYWAEDEWEKKEDLGMNVETNLGTISINTNHIVAHHADDKGETMLRLTNGECFRSPIKHEEFSKMLNEMSVAIELKLTDN